MGLASGRLRLYVHPEGHLASLPGGSGCAATCCLGIPGHRRSGHAVGPTPHQGAPGGSRGCWSALVLPPFCAEAGRKANPVRGGAQPADRLGACSARSSPAFGAGIAAGMSPGTQLLPVAGLGCGRGRGARRVHGSQGSAPAARGEAGLALGGGRGAPEQRVELGYILLPHPRSCPGRALRLGTEQGLVTEGRSVASGPCRATSGETRAGYSGEKQRGNRGAPQGTDTGQRRERPAARLTCTGCRAGSRGLREPPEPPRAAGRRAAAGGPPRAGRTATRPRRTAAPGGGPGDPAEGGRRRQPGHHRPGPGPDPPPAWPRPRGGFGPGRPLPPPPPTRGSAAGTDMAPRARRQPRGAPVPGGNGTGMDGTGVGRGGSGVGTGWARARRVPAPRVPAPGTAAPVSVCRCPQYR